MADELKQEKNLPPPKERVRDEQQPDKWYDGHLWDEKELEQYLIDRDHGLI